MSWHWIVNIGAGGQRDQERCSLMVEISIYCMDVRCSGEEMTGKPMVGKCHDLGLCDEICATVRG